MQFIDTENVFEIVGKYKLSAHIVVNFLAEIS